MRPAGRYAVRNWGTGMQSQRRHDEHDEQDEHDEHDEQDRNRRCDCTFPSLLFRVLSLRWLRPVGFTLGGYAAEKSPYLTPRSERSGDFRRGLRPSVWLKILKPSRGLVLSLLRVFFSSSLFLSFLLFRVFFFRVFPSAFLFRTPTGTNTRKPCKTYLF